MRIRGFDATQGILAADPDCKVLFVSNYWDAVYINAAKELGAAGYVFKSRVAIELASAIRSVLAAEFYNSRP